MKPSEVLLAAREKLAAPGAWTQECFARDRHGEITLPLDSSAVCWCSVGVLKSAGAAAEPREETFGFLWRALGVIAADGCGPHSSLGVIAADVLRWNDAPERTQLEVVEAFERAVLLAQSEGQ